MIVCGQGQVVRMSLPAGWVEGSTQTGPGARLVRNFYPEVSPETTICFYYRGMPISEGSALIFRAMLTEPPHELVEDEFESLQEVLGHIYGAEAYERLTARTQNLNGRRVLVFEGHWIESKRYSMDIFIDADQSGRFVQQIYFLAPLDEYRRYVESVEKAFSSIIWS
jgi:hypothetical protein